MDLSSSYADVIYVDVQAEFRSCYNPGLNKLVPCSSNYFEVYIQPGKPKSIPKSAKLDDFLGTFSTSLVHFRQCITTTAKKDLLTVSS